MRINEFASNLKILASFRRIIRDKNFILGKSVEDFEMEFGARLGVSHVFGVGSGTDALILSLKALGIGPGDEVIVPALSFFSTAGAVSWVNAKPVFADVGEKSFNIDPAKIRRAITHRTKAIIAVHLNGRMADMEPINALAKQNDLYVIEDAAHAFGSAYKKYPPGHYSDIACFSFNPQKILPSFGDGGAVISKNRELADKISPLRLYGAKTMQDVNIRHAVIGIASRLQPFQAAVLSAKLRKFPKILKMWRRNYFLYSELLQNIEDIILPEKVTPGDYFLNGYRYAILVQNRNSLQQYLKTRGIEANAQYRIPLPHIEAFKTLGYKKGDFPIAEKISDGILCLPTQASLAPREIIRTANLIKNFYTRRPVLK